jgi:hypothetical protein
MIDVEDLLKQAEAAFAKECEDFGDWGTLFEECVKAMRIQSQTIEAVRFAYKHRNIDLLGQALDVYDHRLATNDAEDEDG